MVKAVIFDFDGLIIDTESLWFDSYYTTAKNLFNIEVDIKQFALAVGTSEVPYLELIERQLGHSINRVIFIEKATTLFNEEVKHIKPRDGVEEYLKAAKESGYKIGLATSSTYDWVERFLKKFGFLEYFTIIKTSDIVGTKKPDPKVYVEALNDLNVQHSEAIAFEDSLNGYKAATGAGINTVVVPNRLTAYIDFPPNTFKIASMANEELENVINKVFKY